MIFRFRRLLHLSGFVIAILVWYLVSIYFSFSETLLPSPQTVLYASLVLLTDPSFITDLFYTLSKAVIAIILSAALGIPLGFVLGYSRVFYIIFEPLVDMLRSIPVVAAFPIFLLFLGVNDTARIALAVFSGTFIIVINTMYGVYHGNELRKNAAKVMGASNKQIFYYISLREALPYVFAGIRQSLSLVLVIVLVTEMFFGGTNGLGYRIQDSYDFYRIDQMYATIIIIGLIGFGLNVGFFHFQEKMLHWTGK